MANRLARRQMNPDVRIFLPRRVGNELEAITLSNQLDAGLTPGEYDPVHGRTEPSGPTLREWRRRTGRR